MPDTGDGCQEPSLDGTPDSLVRRIRELLTDAWFVSRIPSGTLRAATMGERESGQDSGTELRALAYL